MVPVFLEITPHRTGELATEMPKPKTQNRDQDVEYPDQQHLSRSSFPVEIYFRCLCSFKNYCRVLSKIAKLPPIVSPSEVRSS